MKKTSTFNRAAITTLAAFILLSLTLSSMIIIRTAGDQYFAPKEYTLTKTIPVQELQKAFLRTRDDEMIIDIYLVKSSPDPGNHDLGLLYLLSDVNRKTIAPGKNWDETQFKKGSAWYAGYLRKNNVPESNAVLGYQLKINKAMLRGRNGLYISIFPFGGKKNSFSLKATTPSIRDLSVNDTCRTPPGCTGFPPPYTPELRTILKTTYRN
jgi:hypothetical protein